MAGHQELNFIGAARKTPQGLGFPLIITVELPLFTTRRQSSLEVARVQKYLVPGFLSFLWAWARWLPLLPLPPDWPLLRLVFLLRGGSWCCFGRSWAYPFDALREQGRRVLTQHYFVPQQWLISWGFCKLLWMFGAVVLPLVSFSTTSFSTLCFFYCLHRRFYLLVVHWRWIFFWVLHLFSFLLYFCIGFGYPLQVCFL